MEQPSFRSEGIFRRKTTKNVPVRETAGTVRRQQILPVNELKIVEGEFFDFFEKLSSKILISIKKFKRIT